MPCLVASELLDVEEAAPLVLAVVLLDAALFSGGKSESALTLDDDDASYMSPSYMSPS